MGADTLADALEREHREIDAGIESFVAGLERGEVLGDDLTRAADALRRHIYLEEEFLFPPILHAGLVPPVLVMLREHGVIWQTLDELQEALAEGVDDAREAMADRCRELLSQLESHNSKEEPVIYPRGDAILEDDAKRKLHEFIARGQMPHDWICQQA